MGVDAVWGAAHSCSPGRNGARTRAASLQVRACRAVASTSPYRRKLERTLQGIFGKWGIWRHFVTSETGAAARALEKGAMPGNTRRPQPRAGSRGAGLGGAGDLGGRRDLEACVRLSCPLCAMGTRPGRRAAQACPRRRLRPPPARRSLGLRRRAGPRPPTPAPRPRPSPHAAAARRSPQAGTCLRRQRARAPPIPPLRRRLRS